MSLSVKKVNKDFYADQDCVFSDSVIAKNASGVAQNLAGYTAVGQLRHSNISPQPAATLTCTIPTPSNGVINVSLTRQQTRNLPAGEYYYVVDVYSSDQVEKYRIAYGIVYVDPTINVEPDVSSSSSSSSDGDFSSSSSSSAGN